MKSKRILILTLAGGGGHLQAAKAKRQEILSKDPKTEIFEVDVLIDWVHRRLGIHYLGKWNEWQRTGNVVKQENIVKLHPLSDKLFWPFIFVRALKTIITKDIDHIVDTQILGTSAILTAIQVAKKFTKKTIYMEKVITELPTDQVTHFFRPIKGLSNPQRNYIRLVSTLPLLKENQTAENFWQEQCGLKEESIEYGNLPLRPSFKQIKKQSRIRKKLDVDIHVANSSEQKLIAKAMKKGNSRYKLHPNTISLHIEPEDRVSIVMLGSRPNEHATIEYVKHFINILLNFKNPTRKDLLFVFCSSDRSARGYLLEKISQLVAETSPYPKSLTVIPLPFQEDDVIAPLFFRSDATFTRSGGLTSMELLSVCNGKIWIHAENLQEGKKTIMMPHWEEGNAYYLKQKKGAELITPENFSKVCSTYFS